MTHSRALVALLALALSVLPTGGTAQGTGISGTISSTLLLTSDASLVGDVDCTVVGAPCIRIAASGVRLRLNGFSITGQANPVLGCSGGFTGTEHGIHVAGQQAVDIRGPGLVQRFRGAGIRIDGGSVRTQVRQVTLDTNCNSGIWVAGGGDHDFEANTASRNGNATLPCGGI